jgi:hypothetical protein
MKHFTMIIGFIIAGLGVVMSQATAATSTADEMSNAKFFLGTWTCSHTEDSGPAGTYKTTYANALGNRWLEQTYDFPATATDPAVQGDWFFGYDPRVGRWVRFGAMSDGLYFAMVGARNGDTWSYSYTLPKQSDTVATTYTKTSDAQYRVDGPSYVVNGKMLTEHHLCVRSA